MIAVGAYYPSLGVVLSPSSVHWSHRQVGRGFLAFGMTLAFGAGGFLLGALAADDSECRKNDEGWFCAPVLDGALLGESIGVMVWGIAGVWGLASEESAQRPPRRPAATSLVPDVRARASAGLTLGVAGTF